jgi:hypothetical protein
MGLHGLLQEELYPFTFDLIALTIATKKSKGYEVPCTIL